MSVSSERLYDVFQQADRIVADHETAGVALIALDEFNVVALAEVLESMTADERAEYEDSVKLRFAEARTAYVDWLADF